MPPAREEEGRAPRHRLDTPAEGAIDQSRLADERGQVVGGSARANALQREISLAATSDLKVLITGESGVGKEMVARQIHRESLRARAPMLTVNCAGIPESLLESELFGHVRGAFTDAVRDRAGLLEQADGGTVFLDEIGDMGPRMQASLLRFLENGEIQRIGAGNPLARRVNVRVICATHHDLLRHVAEGRFRSDLFYRLNVVHLSVPPLRERPEDIPALAQHFLELFAGRHRIPTPAIAPVVSAALLAYHWPGNVRELRNVVERLVIRSRNGHIQASDLPAVIRQFAVAPPDSRLDSSEALADHLARIAFARIVERRASFWSAVHDPLHARDLTRETVRRVLRLGVEQVGRRRGALMALFHIDKHEAPRFTRFLRRHLELPGGTGRARTPIVDKVGHDHDDH